MVKIVQNSFLGGQLDFEMMGRQDFAKYAKGATTLKNFIPIKRGPIRKRPGTNYVCEIDTDAYALGTAHKLVPFAYKIDEGWCLLFAPGKILAISKGGTVPVDVENGAVAYTAEEINETGIDYCQCGDVLYLACPTKQPQRIEHTVDGGTHTFTLMKMDFNKQKEFIPVISGATVRKQAVISLGGSVTEKYRVTAVYNGVETFPSAEYSNANDDDSANAPRHGKDKYSSYKKFTEDLSLKNRSIPWEYNPPYTEYEGTAYHAPWTQSQTITLRGTFYKRDDGYWPEQLRIYRKTGGLYGLVGTVDTSYLESTPVEDGGSGSSSDGSIRYSVTVGTVPTGAILSGRLNSIGYGIGATGYTISEATGNQSDGHVIVTFTLPRAAKQVKATIYLGSTVTTETKDGELVTSRGYRYIHSSIDKAKVSVGSQTGSFKTLSHGTTLNVGSVENPITWSRTDFPNLSPLPENPTAEDIAAANAEFRSRADYAFHTYLSDNVSGFREMSEFVIQNVKLSDAQASATATLDIDLGGEAAGSTDQAAVISGIFFEVVSWASSSGGGGGGESKSFTWTDRYYTPDVSLTPPEEEEFMGEEGEYPSCVCLSQQRLIWASTVKDPARIMMSQIGDFYAYAHHEVMVADDPIDFMMSSTRFPKVNHMTELRKLVLFNGDAEWIVDSASAASGITFETIQARRHSGIGADPRLKPIVCNNVLLFAERTGQAVRQYGYQLEDDGYGGTDISICSSSIFRSRRIVAWAYQQHPHSVCWCVLSDGTLCSLTFMREQEAIAWATHALGGNGAAKDIVCTHALLGTSDSNASTSQIFMLVKRGSVWTIEEMRPDAPHGGHSVNHVLCMDSMRKNTGSGQARSGAKIINAYTGAEADDTSGSTYEGFPFESEFTSVHPVVANEVGLAQMDVKCVQHAHLRLADAVGGKIRSAKVAASLADAFEGTELDVEKHEDGQGVYTDYGTVHLKTVDVNVPMRGDNNRDGRVTVTQDEPWPITLEMLETDIECEQEGRR